MVESTSHALRKFAAGLLAIAVGGCASVPKVELERSSAARIEKVALLKVPPAPSPTVTNSGGAASAFGALGALVQLGTNASHGTSYAAAVADRSAALAPGTTAALADALSTAGYRVALADEDADSYRYGSFDDLMAEATRSAEAFGEAARAIVAKVRDDLWRQ